MPTLTPTSTKTASKVLAASHIGVDLTIGAVAGLLPSIRDELSLTGSQIAAVATVLATVSSFGQPVAGWIIDRLGPRRLAVVSAAITSIVLASIPLVRSFTLLTVVAAAGGLAAAVYHPATATLVRSATDDRSAASALGLFAAGGTIGLAVGPSLATATSDRSALLTSLVLALPGVAMAVVVGVTVTRQPSSESTRRRTPTSAPPLDARVATLIGAMTAVYVASITITTAVPLWLADQDVDGAIGPTLGAFSLAAAGGGIIGGRIASTKHPLAAAHGMVVAPFVFLALGRLAPGSLGWYATVAAGGALAHLIVPAAIDAAQERLDGAVAAASGLMMGLPIGLASLIYLGFSITFDPIELGHVTVIATSATAAATALAHAAFSPERTPRDRRTPACTCTGGALAIATC